MYTLFPWQATLATQAVDTSSNRNSNSNTNDLHIENFGISNTSGRHGEAVAPVG